MTTKLEALTQRLNDDPALSDALSEYLREHAAERDALRAEVERLRLDVGRLLVAYGSRDEFDGVDDAIEDAAEMRAENNRLRAFVAALRSDGLDIDDPDTAPHWTGKIHAPDGRLVFDLATVGEPRKP